MPITELSDSRYEELRNHLQEWLGRPFTLERAKSIGDSLIDFYTILGAPNSDSSEEGDAPKP